LACAHGDGEGETGLSVACLRYLERTRSRRRKRKEKRRLGNKGRKKNTGRDEVFSNERLVGRD
jgi:hypothetical protein